MSSLRNWCSGVFGSLLAPSQELPNDRSHTTAAPHGSSTTHSGWSAHGPQVWCVRHHIPGQQLPSPSPSEHGLFTCGAYIIQDAAAHVVLQYQRTAAAGVIIGAFVCNHPLSGRSPIYAAELFGTSLQTLPHPCPRRSTNVRGSLRHHLRGCGRCRR